jgi:hypothetical protein
MWQDRGMATPKQNIRIPRERWEALMARASSVHASDASKVLNALAEEYAEGSPALDEVVSRRLADGRFRPWPREGQVHSASG